MELVIFIIAVLAFAGDALAVLERLRCKTFLKHDFNADMSGQSEADRERMRIEEKIGAVDHTDRGPLS